MAVPSGDGTGGRRIAALPAKTAAAVSPQVASLALLSHPSGEFQLLRRTCPELQRFRRITKDLLPGVPGRADEFRIDIDQTAVVADTHRIEAGIEQRAELLLAAADLFLRFYQFADVARGRDGAAPAP